MWAEPCIIASMAMAAYSCGGVFLRTYKHE